MFRPPDYVVHIQVKDPYSTQPTKNGSDTIESNTLTENQAKIGTEIKAGEKERNETYILENKSAEIKVEKGYQCISLQTCRKVKA